LLAFAVSTSEYSTALACAPAGVSENNQFFRLCEFVHNRNNWLFAGSLRAGKRAAAIMSLIQSAKLNGLNPHAYLKDVLTRLPTHPNSRIDELLPHNWVAPQADGVDAVSEKICA